MRAAEESHVTPLSFSTCGGVPSYARKWVLFRVLGPGGTRLEIRNELDEFGIHKVMLNRNCLCVALRLLLILWQSDCQLTYLIRSSEVGEVEHKMWCVM